MLIFRELQSTRGCVVSAGKSRKIKGGGRESCPISETLYSVRCPPRKTSILSRIFPSIGIEAQEQGYVPHRSRLVFRSGRSRTSQAVGKGFQWGLFDLRGTRARSYNGERGSWKRRRAQPEPHLALSCKTASQLGSTLACCVHRCSAPSPNPRITGVPVFVAAVWSRFF